MFLTGGTGFFGSWLLESLVWANEQADAAVEVVVLTRNPAEFSRRAPHLARHAAVTLHVGDVRDFAFPTGPFAAVIHAATDTNVPDGPVAQLQLIDSIVAGTRRVLDFTVAVEARRLLLTSSGAVYGRQPADLPRLTEDYSGAPAPLALGASYGEGKRLAELLCRLYADGHGVEPIIARCFAFVGPYLSLRSRFAAADFLASRLRAEPIHVAGDGTARRSYLYAADLASWLWTLLVAGNPNRAYNVGSESDVSIGDFAHQVAAAGGGVASVVQVDRPAVDAATIERYVPSTHRIRSELGVAETVALPDALERTIRWHRSQTFPGEL